MVDIVEGFEDMVIYDDKGMGIKGDALIGLAKIHNPRVFVETGTYAGEMLKYVMAGYKFDKVYSIELSERLAARAKKLFADDPTITIMQGDSGEMLKAIPQDEPILYWLDAHACGGVTARGKKITPILEELETVVNEMNHIIVIDDIDNLPRWGVTYNQLTSFISGRKKVKYTDIFTMLIVEPE